MEKYRREDTRSYCLGMSLSIEAIKHASSSVKTVYLSDKCHKNSQFSYLSDLCHKRDIPMVYDDRQIEKLSAKENCYAIAVFDKYERKLSDGPHILLYDFHSFGDAGTIMRSAVSFDFHDFVFIGNELDYFDPRCVRSSMGSLFHLNIAHYQSAEDYQRDYPSHEILPFISKGEDIEQMDLPENYAFLIPEDYYALDEIYKKGYSVDHKGLKEISLSSLSSILFSECYHRKRRR